MRKKERKKGKEEKDMLTIECVCNEIIVENTSEWNKRKKYMKNWE